MTTNLRSKNKRLSEWRSWLAAFKAAVEKENPLQKVRYIPNAALLINDIYWQLAEQYLRPLLTPDINKTDEPEHRIHPYKIISASEIAIMMTEPIKYDKNKKTASMLAWFVATQILLSWKIGTKVLIKMSAIDEMSLYREKTDDTNEYPESFSMEHMRWLSKLNVTNEKPILINAQCWRMFYLGCLAISTKGKLTK